MNVIFRLNTNVTGFENFKIAREFFLNILPIRDNNYFFNTKRLNQIELDDIIYFLYGKEIIAKAKFLGEIKEDTKRDEKFIQGHKVKILDIFDEGFFINVDELNQKTTRSIGYIDDEDTNYIENILNNKNIKSINQNIGKTMPKSTQKQALNQILYGSPGTGKTFNTINKAIEIIDSDFYQQNKYNREALKEKFEEYKKAGQIEFITFHQSFSYEEFVEGIKAIPAGKDGNENGEDMIYDVVDGIFKKLSNKAKIDFFENNSIKKNITKRKFILNAKALNIQAEMIEDDENNFRVLKGSKMRKGYATSFEQYNYFKLRKEVEEKLMYLESWTLPQYLSDQTVLTDVSQAVKEGGWSNAPQGLFSGRIPPFVCVSTHGKTYMPFILQSISAPIVAPIDEAGNRLSLAVTLSLMSETAWDAQDVQNLYKFEK